MYICVYVHVAVEKLVVIFVSIKADGTKVSIKKKTGKETREWEWEVENLARSLSQ